MPDPTERRVTSSTGGEKGAKLARYDLIPAGPLRALAELYGKGAEKYEDRNWERGYDWSLSFAALNRHLWLFWQGVTTDEETGLPHLAAVAWHAFALMEWTNTHREFDNRPPHTPLSEAVAAVLDEDDRAASTPKVDGVVIDRDGDYWAPFPDGTLWGWERTADEALRYALDSGLQAYSWPYERVAEMYGPLLHVRK